MAQFFARRLAMAIPTLVIVAVLVFMLVRFIPGDPAQILLGELADPASLSELRERMGLNHGLLEQFMIWVAHACHGDFGRSISTGQPVLPLIWSRFLTSASIVMPALIMALAVALPAGTYAAWKKDRAADLGVVTVSSILLSIPTFWMGLLLLIGFGVKLRWLPVVGYVSLREDFGMGVVYLLLPIATLVLHEIGVLVRMVRASTIEVFGLDYVTHARAKGLADWTVVRRHVLKNAFSPTWTMVGIVLGNLLGGVAVVETVFTIPGLGRLIVDSIFSRDYPVIQGCLLLTGTIYVAVNTLTDLLYPVFDPRVRAE